MDKYLGKMLDSRYEILEIMGIGGMAYVYKARCHLLNRLVAVKILKEEYASDADFRRRFHAESQAVAMLGHPNIVAVYDVSRSTELEYIVMELIDGITLKQYMQKKGLLSWREALHFVIQIVKALSHAHSRGIIHRDIKPHNIMILRDGSVKVADFGIARFASKQNTLTQEALGSVHYISPEQARGSHIDARSDLYSVGVVLYEMLTERLPFEGDSPVSVALQHINSLPLTPREVNPEIPDALEMIIIKAMAPKLSQRYDSAEDMLRDLEEFRKNPSIAFEYDVSELKTPADELIEEPTRSLPGGGAKSTGPTVKLDPKREAEERKRIKKEMIAEENHKTRRAGNLIATLSAVLGVLGLVAVLGFVIVNLVGDAINVDPFDEIEVPNFKGTDYTAAFIDSLFDPLYNDFTFEMEPVSSDIFPRNKIFDQDPQPGKRSKGKDEKLLIVLFVSTGRETILLEDLTGKDEHAARIWLDGEGLRYTRKTENDDTVPRGSVIRTEPSGGEQIYRDTDIVLYISLGKDILEVEMPDLLTHPVYEQEAKNTLSFYNLVAVPIVVESDEPAGLVLWQEIPAGEKIAENTEVIIHISEGPEEIIEPSPEDPSPPEDTPADPSAPDVSAEPPPPSPSEEIPSPVDVQPVTITRQIQPPLDKTGTMLVEVYQNDTKIYEETISSDGPPPTVTITGYPEDIIKVYFDGEETYTHPFKDLI